ncbi:MAG TPA: type IV secretion system DNA-binding domain-containing protein [Patescibacteria group bacterium]|nr:type IV secretion system DNA-binding domain-containing protein [Patescibacteria group bacterium]
MNEDKDITYFAKANYRNTMTPFGIRTDDRRRHMYVIGKTGMGKTTLLENMCIQDIQNGRGVCFIDPHGDSLQKILNCIPTSRINDVIYFNPADLEYPIAFNILEAVEGKYKHLVASGLMGVFTKIWANMWSARMEYILNNTILALLDSPGNTMLGITRMYVDKKYRKRIIDNVKDPIVRAFWVEEYANYNDKYRTEAIAPIQNKVGQFLSSAIIRNIVGQPKSTLDLRDIMDDKKILFMDLSKGKVGEDNSALLGAMVITKLQLAALSRVDVPEQERKDYYLYVDEFQNFATDSFATILSEARKYRLNLIIGHQYIGQLTPDKNNTKIRDAVFGNVGTMVIFRIGAADAEYLETEFAPYFLPGDMVNLPKANIILKLMINGVTSEGFSAVTLPPIDKDYFTGNAEKVIKVSRERYANHYLAVEEKISRWMGADFMAGQAAMMSSTEDEEESEAPRAVGPARPSPTPVMRALPRQTQIQAQKPVVNEDLYREKLKSLRDVEYDTSLLQPEGEEDEVNSLADEVVHNENDDAPTIVEHVQEVPQTIEPMEQNTPDVPVEEARPKREKAPRTEALNVEFGHGFLATGDRQLTKRYLENSQRFATPRPPRRNLDRDRSRPPRRGGGRPASYQKPKPLSKHQPKPKNSNPVWELAGKLQQEKIQASPPSEISSSRQETPPQDNVIKLGEVMKF